MSALFPFKVLDARRYGSEIEFIGSFGDSTWQKLQFMELSVINASKNLISICLSQNKATFTFHKVNVQII